MAYWQRAPRRYLDKDPLHLRRELRIRYRACVNAMRNGVCQQYNTCNTATANQGILERTN